MSWYNKVAWTEGLFLRPQLFQQQERYLEHLAHRRAEPLNPFFWGFSKFELDTEALPLGRIGVNAAEGIFADGTPFDAPAHTDLPAPLTIEPDHVGQTLCLALPARAAQSEETTFEEPSPASTSLARYSVFDEEVRDANSTGLGAKTVQLSQLRLRLLPQAQLNPGWQGLPVARVTKRHADGSIELDTTLMPPVSVFGASTVLAGWVGNLHGLCELRAQALATRLCGNDGKSSEVAEVADFLLLQVLNRHQPVLSHWLNVRRIGTERLYALLLAMSGELATLVRPSTRRPPSYHPYEHNNPYWSFRDLIWDVHLMMNDVLERSAQKIPLGSRPNGLSIANIDPVEFKGYASLVFAVSAQMPANELVSQFPARCKLGPNDRLAELIRSHLPGIPLMPLPVPPRQMPFHAGFVYFQIESGGPLWDHLAKHGGLALHVGTEFPSLTLELWGIREK